MVSSIIVGVGRLRTDTFVGAATGTDSRSTVEGHGGSAHAFCNRRTASRIASLSGTRVSQVEAILANQLRSGWSAQGAVR